MQEAVAERTIGGYLAALAGEQSAPGGGSAAGVVGALAAAAAEMLASLTRDPSTSLREAAIQLQELRASALTSARADEMAYGTYIAAMKLPKETSEEKAARKHAMADALEEAARVPLHLAVTAIEILNALEAVIAEGNKTVLGDAETAVVLAQATVDICVINVQANLPYIKDEALAAELRESIEAAHELIVRLAAERRGQINERRAS